MPAILSISAETSRFGDIINGDETISYVERKKLQPQYLYEGVNIYFSGQGQRYRAVLSGDVDGNTTIDGIEPINEFDHDTFLDLEFPKDLDKWPISDTSLVDGNYSIHPIWRFLPSKQVNPVE